MHAVTQGKQSTRIVSRRTLITLAVWAVVALLVVGPSILHSKAGIGISPILTGSMRPFADPGDVFITRLTPASELRVGDIVSLYSESTGVFYAHRIIEIRPQSGLLRIVTKGDANGSAEVDPYLVGGSQTVGKEILTVRWLGHPLVFLTSIQGRQAGLALIVVANVIALFLFLFRRGPAVQKIDSDRTVIDALALSHAQIIINEGDLQLYRRFTTKHVGDAALTEFLLTLHPDHANHIEPIKEST